MAEAGNHRVNVFAMEGNFKFLFGGPGTEPGQMNNPEASKANSQGMIYVADLKNDRVQVFTKDGKFVKLWGKTTELTVTSAQLKEQATTLARMGETLQEVVSRFEL